MENVSQRNMVPEGALILSDGRYYSRDTRASGLNNNVLVVGSSGSGKTRSVISPNLLQAEGSYLISDPKGTLVRKYGPYLKKKGYRVETLDLTRPKESTHYNPMAFLETEEDIVSFAHTLTYLEDSLYSGSKIDPFWNEAAQMLLTALTAYLVGEQEMKDRTIHQIIHLLLQADVDENYSETSSPLDKLFEGAYFMDQDALAYRSYQLFRQAAGKTLKSILISLSTKLASLDTEELKEMMGTNEVDFTRLGKEKTALFIIVSDSDRSRDVLCDLIVDQCLKSLLNYADRECPDQCLPVGVTFILDDFATNVKIIDFPKTISMIRSRGISAILSLQNLGQLYALYEQEASTVIGNCDTILYLGGNDLETARDMAVRANLPLPDLLNMKVGRTWIFRRGEEPYSGKTFPLDPFEKDKMKEAGIGIGIRRMPGELIKA